MSEISIVDLVTGLMTASVTNSKDLGRRAIGICPFCNNRMTKSFIVSDNEARYACYSCGESGTAEDFLVKACGYTEYEASDYLNRMAGKPAELTSAANEHNKDLITANKHAANFYYKCLKEGKEEGSRKAYEYLKDRGLTDETIRKFGLGFSRYGVCGHLKKEGITESSLIECGLGKASDGKCKDKMFNRVMFPIVKPTSNGDIVVGFGGRLMQYPDPKYPNAPKYLNTASTLLFDKKSTLYAWNFASKSKRKGIVLCEGYMDVISLHQAGFDNATATLGTAFTRYHAMLIRKKTDTVYICYDSDEAGVKAKLKAIPILKAAGLNVRILSCYPSKDPDELIKNGGSKAFEKVLAKSMDSYDYVVLQMREMADNEEDFKKKFAHLIINSSKQDFDSFIDAYNKGSKKTDNIYKEILDGYQLKF